MKIFERISKNGVWFEKSDCDLQVLGCSDDCNIADLDFSDDRNSHKYCKIKVKYNAFFGNNSVRKIKIPSNIKSIGQSAFANCCNLTEFEVDSENKLFSAENGVLYNYDKTILICCGGGIEEVNIADTVTEISKGAFLGCKKLKSIVLPENVKSILEYAFKDCENLELITFNAKLSEIEDNAFEGCSKEKLKFDFMDNIPSYEYAICNGFSIIEHTQPQKTNDDIIVIDNLSYLKENNMICVSNYSSDMEVADFGMYYKKFPDDVKIPMFAEHFSFRDCYNLKCIKIPDNFTCIGDGAIKRCNKLSDFVVSEGNQHFSAENGLLFNKDKSMICLCGGGVSEVIIPETVRTISYGAFEDNIYLTEIYIPDNVETIINDAFSFCTNLKRVRLPAGLQELSWGVFNGCKSLTEIELPNGLTRIGSYSFSRCTNLRKVVIPRSVKKIVNNSFDNCNKGKLVLRVYRNSFAEAYAKHYGFYLSYID